METTETESLIDQVRRVMRDGIDYLGSMLKLQQVRLTSLTLSAVMFMAQLAFAAILGFAAFVMLNVAVGIALTHWLGNPIWSLLILSAVYGIIGWLVVRKAMKWLNTIRS